MATTGSPDLEHNKNVDCVSKIMTVLTCKDGDLASYNIKTDENKTNNTSFKQIFKNIHDVSANKAKTEGEFQLKHVFVFCKAFKN